MNELQEELVRVVNFLDAHRVPYMVIGGFANLFWGDPRTTEDIDITIEMDIADWDAARSIFEEVGHFEASDPQDLALRGRVVPLRCPSGIRVDFILGTLSFEFAAIKRARIVKVDGHEVRVCAPEDLVIHKLVSVRAKDLEDVVGLLRRQGADLDMVSLQQSVGELAAGVEDPRILERFIQARQEAGI